MLTITLLRESQQLQLQFVGYNKEMTMKKIITFFFGNYTFTKVKNQREKKSNKKKLVNFFS